MAIIQNDLGQYRKIGGPDASAHEVSSSTRMEHRRLKSWKAPVTMIAALVAGLALALIHHFLNAFLNGQEVERVGLSQSWVSRITTALAFLVKTCWAVTTGVAFVQRQWFNLHEEPLRIKDIDALTGVLGNVFSFFDSLIWFKTPVLTIIAIITWTIPFAAVITPGSLSVQQNPALNSTHLQVPQLMFNGTTYGELGGGSQYGEVHANDLVYKLGYTTAITGKQIPLLSAYQNETYHLSFDGPAVRCRPANQTVTNAAAKMFREQNTGNTVSFLSWVAGDERGSSNSNISSPIKQNYASSTYDTIDVGSTDVSRIFIMTKQVFDPNVTVTECQLYNATYEVGFNFQNRNQTLDVSTLKYLNPVPASQSKPASNANASTILAYSSVMEVFGRVLVGYVGTSHYGVTTRLLTSSNWLTINWTNAESTQQGLESLFQNMTLGLFSDEALTKNSTLAASIPVTITNYPITYHYNTYDLWIAYGVSGICALACLIVGMHAFTRNQASYQNIFSTFIRSTSQSEIRHWIQDRDDGADALPKDLAGIKVDLGIPSEYAMKNIIRRKPVPIVS